MVTLREAQDMMRVRYFERDSSRGVYATFTWLVEEIGELAEAILSGNKESIEEEIADVIAWTLSLANLLGVDVERSFLKKYPKEV
jgi:NTP pyrophosphatase (non-canonical NTP hydrolase)